MASKSASKPRVLVCRVAWMREYKGQSATDVPHGGGAYVQEHGWGHEMFNFRREKEGYFGFVQPRGVGINIARLTGVEDATEANGLTVFWVATHPTEGNARVVGWYKRATAYAEGQEPIGLGRKLPDGRQAWFYVRAPKVRLLGLAERDFVVPRTKGAMGQSNVWYPDDAWSSKLTAYARGATTIPAPPKSAKGSYVPHQQDTARRLEIERAAMEATRVHYAALHYAVKDVSDDNVGWDLECRKGPVILRVEVKGTSATWPVVCVEVTPNEYAKMTAPELRELYRLSIVCVARNSRTVVVFSWSHKTARWISETGAAALTVKPLIAARLEVTMDE